MVKFCLYPARAEKWVPVPGVVDGASVAAVLDVKRKPTQLSPVYLNQPFCKLLQYSSPVKGLDGAVEDTLNLPAIDVMCDCAIFTLYGCSS